MLQSTGMSAMTGCSRRHTLVSIFVPHVHAHACSFERAAGRGGEDAANESNASGICANVGMS
jgi:hypothetical protein